MRPGLILLALAVLSATCHSQESCVNRCEYGFDARKTCQCDSMCRYYKSCCSDYETACRMHIRGDTFVFAEDDDEQMNTTEGTGRAQSRERQPAPFSTPMAATEAGTGAASTAGTTPRPTHDSPESAEHILATVVPPITTDDPNTTTVAAPRTTDVPDINHITAPSTTEVSDINHITAPSTTEAPSITATVQGTTDMFTSTDHDRTSPSAAANTEILPTEQETPTPEPKPTHALDPDANACSGRAFDAFLQLKNGTIFAFRGEYFFGLDDKALLPGYPRLIKDVWGISGPIDAAFTRINCQGKTYIFKGNKYWRFEDEVLDDDYPRDLTVGFEKIPDDIDAAFSTPAHGHHGKEKVYFFKGDQYYQYEFKHQPTHEECIQMSLRSPSVPFLQYTNMYYDSWDGLYSTLFEGFPGHHHGPHFINKDWKGLKAPIDGVMAGRLYIAPRPPGRQYPNRNNNQQQWGQDWDQQWVPRRRQNRSPQWQPMAQWGANIGREFAERGMNIGREFAERGMNIGRESMGRGRDDRLRDMEDRRRDEADRRRDEEDRQRDRWRDDHRRRYDYDYRHDPREDYFLDMLRKSQPVQSVYFFKGDKYYRVDLQSKRVDPASPPYPRSIGKYWLGCKEKPGAEKK